MIVFASKKGLGLHWLMVTVFAAASIQDVLAQEAPHLHGQHFRITALDDKLFLNVDENKEDSKLSYSGYIIEMLEALASKANFTYELLTPSGFGPSCHPQLQLNNSNNEEILRAYEARYRFQFDCGVDDVNELQGTNFSTDMYLGLLYITPERQLKNYFTVAFHPPFKGTPVMVGTSTGIPTIHDLVEQQALGNHPPACVLGNSGMMEFIQDNFPGIQLKAFHGEEEVKNSFDSGACPIYIVTSTHAKQFVLKRYLEGTCFIDGKPLGMIGEPLDSGLSQHAIGVGKHVDRAVVDILSYWMNILMIDGTFASLFQGHGGTGKECGYVLFPETEDDNLLSAAGLAIVVLGAVAVVTIPLYLWYRRSLQQQEKRYKKRFVQQIARNIEIGRRPGCISPEKLCEEILHIGQGKDVIKKADLSKWMHDIKMNFISENDFDALWNAIDVDGVGEVSAVEFVVFLSACGPEFEEVYEEQKKMPKMERLKLAARRLTNLSSMGEAGVRQLERRLDSGRTLLPHPSGTLDSTSNHSQSSWLHVPPTLEE